MAWAADEHVLPRVVHQHEHGEGHGPWLHHDGVHRHAFSGQDRAHAVAQRVVADGAQRVHVHAQARPGDEEIARAPRLDAHAMRLLVLLSHDRQLRDRKYQVGHQIA